MKIVIFYVFISIFVISCSLESDKSNSEDFKSGTEDDEHISKENQDDDLHENIIDHIDTPAFEQELDIEEIENENIPDENSFQKPLPDSPYEEIEKEIGKSTINKKDFDNLPFSIDFYYPIEKGKLPVMIFLSGLNGFTPGELYSELFKKIAARGVILAFPKGAILLPNQFDKRAEDLADVIKWMKSSNFSAAVSWASKSASPTPDISSLTISGHSSGAQAIVEVYRDLEKDIGGIFLMDPVDGDPFEFSKKVVPENDILTDTTPVYILETGLGPVKGVNTKIWPACAPAPISADHFAPAFQGPKWHITVPNFGHIDMLDDVARKGVVTIRFCSGAKESNFPRYRNFIAGSVSSFVKFVNGDDSYLPYLEDSDLMPLETEIEHNHQIH